MDGSPMTQNFPLLIYLLTFTIELIKDKDFDEGQFNSYVALRGWMVLPFFRDTVRQ